MVAADFSLFTFAFTLNFVFLHAIKGKKTLTNKINSKKDAYKRKHVMDGNLLDSTCRHGILRRMLR